MDWRLVRHMSREMDRASEVTHMTHMRMIPNDHRFTFNFSRGGSSSFCVSIRGSLEISRSLFSAPLFVEAPSSVVPLKGKPRLATSNQEETAKPTAGDAAMTAFPVQMHVDYLRRGSPWWRWREFF